MDVRELRQLHNIKGNKLEYLFFYRSNPKLPASVVNKTCLSQWHYSSFKINNVQYLTAEHYMMVEKAKLFNDNHIVSEIFKTSNPATVKALGRKVKNFDYYVWLRHCFDIVVTGNLAKFSQNPRLAEYLLSTEQKILVEASPCDKLWGIGLSENSNGIDNPLNWQGKNLLGFALMEVREKLRKEK